MSGILVGEVIDAAEAGTLPALSRPAFSALIAIAEKADHKTRQGSVRQSRIRAAIYARNSPRTAVRAVKELKDAGLVTVVKRGFKAPDGSGAATVYQLATLNKACATETACADQEAHATQLASATGEAHAKSDEAHAKSAQAHATLGGAYDGFIDGSIDGTTQRVARKRATPLPNNWAPDATTISEMTAKYPLLDIPDEIEAFTDKAAANGWTYVDHTAAFRIWLRKAEEYRLRHPTHAPATSGHSNNDDKVAGWASIATGALRRELQQ